MFMAHRCCRGSAPPNIRCITGFYHLPGSQRPDGIFIHATDGPYVGDAAIRVACVTEALTHLPPAWSDRARVLEIYRRHVAALAKLQSDDGSWRQVVDEPTAIAADGDGDDDRSDGAEVSVCYRSLDVRAIINRGWNAVASRGTPTARSRMCRGLSRPTKRVLPQSSGRTWPTIAAAPWRCWPH